MKSLILVVAISLFAFVGTSNAHCGSCGVGDETHEAQAADGEKAVCAQCGHVRGSEACAEGCAKMKGEKCSDCGAVKGSEHCDKSCTD